MKTFELQATKRETTGSKNARELRAKGMVPCVLYGGTTPHHFFADERHVSKLVITPEVFNVKLAIGDDRFSSLVKDVQFHPVTDKITHIDFLEISETKPAIISLPVNVLGTAAGVKAGGRLKLNMRKIAVEGLASALPEKIEINIEELKIGDSVRVKELKYNLKFVDSPETIVVGVRTQRKVEEEVVATPAAAAGTTPAAGAAGATPAAGAAAGAPGAGDAKGKAGAGDAKGKAEAKPEGKGKK